MSAGTGFRSSVGLGTLTKNTAFQPLFTGPLLLYTLRLIPQIPNHFIPGIINSITPFINRSKATAILATLFVLGVLRKLNKWLSDQAANNFITDKYDWSKEIVVVTGGSSGMGELVTKDLSQRGIQVVIIDIVKPKYELAPTATFFRCDLSKPDDISTTCDEIRTKIGNPTILLNNAGIASGKPLLQTSSDEYQKMFSIHNIAHFLLILEFLPSMIANNHGHILTIASMASFITMPWNVSYSQAKSSALAFHEGLTLELRHVYDAPKVRTSIFHPTWVDTPLIKHLTRLREWKEPTLRAEDVAGRIVERILSGRGAQEVLPRSLGPVTGFRGFPVWMQEGLRNWGGRMARALQGEGGLVVLERKEES